MSDLLPVPAPPPASTEPEHRPGWWWRLAHPRAARQARLLAAHHAWTTERARVAQTDLVRAGFHPGPVPFGYLPHRITVLDAGGQRRRRVRLVLDPGPAAVVAAVFRWRVDDRLSARSISTRLRGLQNDLFYAPVAPDTGLPRLLWTPTAVDRVLTNPIYTGATVWGRTHAGRPVPPEHWVVCLHAHQPIVDGRTFFHARLLATPATAVLSPLLLPWEFPEDSPIKPRTDSDDAGPESPDGRWK